MTGSPISERLFDALTGDDVPGPGTGGARDFLRHVVALGLTKSGDGLADAKLVLSWLMAHLGAPTVLIGLLVPVREAGALLPQIFAAPRIRALARRKWAWAGAAAVQGAAILVIASTGVALSGVVAGGVILAALAVLALARSVASVSHKDVLGKTVAQGARGSATGLATSAAAAVVIVFAALLMTGIVDRFALVTGALVLAGAAFLGAAAVFAGLDEAADDPDPPGGGPASALANLGLLRSDPVLARFILARGLLTATALAPPYVVVLAAGEAGGLDALGAMVLAGALAGLVSGAVWGRLSDRSSRQVLIATGLAGAAALALAVGLSMAGWAAALPLALFGVMVAHQGVRVGRSTYLVDMAPPDDRATYTAVANTVIGLALLAAGGLGALAAMAGAAAALGLFAAMALAGAGVAHGLKEIG